MERWNLAFRRRRIEMRHKDEPERYNGLAKRVVVGLAGALIFAALGVSTPAEAAEAEPQSYTVAGRIVDADFDWGVPDVRIGVNGETVTTTDVEGRWEAEISGTVTVTPKHSGPDFTPAEKEVSSASSDVSFEAKWDPPTAVPPTLYDVSGRVMSSDAEGVEGIEVNAGGQAAVTDAEGYWEATILELRPIRVRLSTPEDQTAKPIASTSGRGLSDFVTTGIA